MTYWTVCFQLFPFRSRDSFAELVPFSVQIASTLTFAAASASAGITVLIGNDLDKCAMNHCARFESATAMAFISWFVASPSFLFNFWSLASQ